MQFEYLIFNFLIIIGPVLVIVFSKTAIKPQLLPSIFSIALTSILFLAWDHYATGLFWNFNEQFIIGLKITNLPIEEILFFITVPLACLLLHVNLMRKVKNIHLNTAFVYLLLVSISLLPGLYLLISNILYTATVLLALSAILLIDGFIIKTRLLLIKSYYIFLCMLFALTFIFNLYLTARPVLIYNHAYNTGMQILTIPIEDFIYSFVLMLMTTSFYEHFRRLFKHEKNSGK